MRADLSNNFKYMYNYKLIFTLNFFIIHILVIGIVLS